MAGGDMRVQNRPIGTLGALNQLEVIDAHSAKAGTFTESRNVNGQNIWLTKSGAEAYDRLAADFDMKASKDPSGFAKWWGGELKAETHLGSVK